MPTGADNRHRSASYNPLPMSLPPGTRIGPYDVVGPLGAGGMGEVYRATDTNLKRQVALKVLPAALAADTERLARFQREAEVLAALNHPHIAGIYGLEKSGEVTALVMELVEGDDLAQRLSRGAIPLDDALPIARQIAEALEAAHDQGIIHRDLKPANVKVRPDGTVKVLDFGLAKALDTADPHAPGNQANSPTITSPAMTMRGVILGTAAYMSPEQAKGKAVDRRADIWAFGAVLFEMLTGSRAFDGEDVTETIIAVITKDPDWSRLPASTPPAVMTLLRRCLEKHAPKRLPHIGVARLELESPAPAPGAASMPSAIAPLKSGRTGVLAWAGMAAALAAGITGGMWWASRTAPAVPASIYRSTLLIPSEQSLIGNAPSNRFALSPDGRAPRLRRNDRADAAALAAGAGRHHRTDHDRDARRELALLVARQPLRGVLRRRQAPEGRPRRWASRDDRPEPVLCRERPGHLEHRQRDHRRRAEHQWRGTPAHLGAGRNARTADLAGPGRARDRARQFGPSGGRRRRQPVWRGRPAQLRPLPPRRPALPVRGIQRDCAGCDLRGDTRPAWRARQADGGRVQSPGCAGRVGLHARQCAGDAAIRSRNPDAVR